MFHLLPGIYVLDLETGEYRHCVQELTFYRCIRVGRILFAQVEESFQILELDFGDLTYKLFDMPNPSRCTFTKLEGQDDILLVPLNLGVPLHWNPKTGNFVLYDKIPKFDSQTECFTAAVEQSGDAYWLYCRRPYCLVRLDPLTGKMTVFHFQTIDAQSCGEINMYHNALLLWQGLKTFVVLLGDTLQEAKLSLLLPEDFPFAAYAKERLAVPPEQEKGMIPMTVLPLQNILDDWETFQTYAFKNHHVSCKENS
jgi:hypothetical protein